MFPLPFTTHWLLSLVRSAKRVRRRQQLLENTLPLEGSLALSAHADRAIIISKLRSCLAQALEDHLPREHGEEPACLGAKGFAQER